MMPARAPRVHNKHGSRKHPGQHHLFEQATSTARPNGAEAGPFSSSSSDEGREGRAIAAMQQPCNFDTEWKGFEIWRAALTKPHSNSLSGKHRRIARRLMRDGATCFWVAVALLVREEDLPLLLLRYEQYDLTEGVSPLQGVQYCLELSRTIASFRLTPPPFVKRRIFVALFDHSLGVFDPYIEGLSVDKRQTQASDRFLAYVPFDNRSLPCYHWLPAGGPLKEGSASMLRSAFTLAQLPSAPADVASSSSNLPPLLASSDPNVPSPLIRLDLLDFPAFDANLPSFVTPVDPALVDQIACSSSAVFSGVATGPISRPLFGGCSSLPVVSGPATSATEVIESPAVAVNSVAEVVSSSAEANLVSPSPAALGGVAGSSSIPCGDPPGTASSAFHSPESDDPVTARLRTEVFRDAMVKHGAIESMPARQAHWPADRKSVV